MRICPNDWYSEDYFYPKSRKYVDQFGVERIYYGPSKDWDGFSQIAGFIKTNYPDVHTLFDVGCSAGAFVSRSIEAGFDSYGCDISKFAITNCIHGAKKRVFVSDITKITPQKQYDMVTAFDLMEHIYQKDLDACLNFIVGSVGKYFFADIATARIENELFQHPDENTEIPPDKTWLAVSGHVNIKFLKSWIDIFEKKGLKTCYDLMYKFQIWRMSHYDMSQVESWGINNIYIGMR